MRAKIFTLLFAALLPVIWSKPQSSQPQLAVMPHVQVAPTPSQSSEPQEPVTLAVISPTSQQTDGVTQHDLMQPHVDPVPPQCPRLYRPVCGSDNKTYNSPCELQAAQRSDSSLVLQKEGPC